MAEDKFKCYIGDDEIVGLTIIARLDEATTHKLLSKKWNVEHKKEEEGAFEKEHGKKTSKTLETSLSKVKWLTVKPIVQQRRNIIIQLYLLC